MPRVETPQAFGQETFAPKADRIDAAAQFPSHLPLGRATRQPQNDIRAANIFCGEGSATHFSFEFGTNQWAQFQFGGHERSVPNVCIRSQCYSSLVFDDAHVAPSVIRDCFTLRLDAAHPAWLPTLSSLQPYFATTQY